LKEFDVYVLGIKCVPRYMGTEYQQGGDCFPHVLSWVEFELWCGSMYPRS